MNPRRPTPAGPEPAPHISGSSNSIHGFPSHGASDMRVIRGKRDGASAALPGEKELKAFYEWCVGKGTSPRTCEQYARYLRKPLDMGNKWSRLAWKAYAKFAGDEELWKSIKVKRSNPDLYVPSDEDVLFTVRQACRVSRELCWVYRLLVYSGLRLTEVARVLGESEDARWVRLQGFYKYPLAWRRGSKQAIYAYSLEKPPRLRVDPDRVSDWASEAKKEEPRIVSPKYVRKWVATKMLSLGIPEEVVNFIQGRVPQEVLSKHYLKLSVLADQYYPRYAEWLRNNII